MQSRLASLIEALNCNMDTRWNGVYAPPTTGWRARVIMARIESYTSAPRFAQEDKNEEIQS